MKKCSTCGKELPDENFYKGRGLLCKSCAKEYDASYRNNNKKAILEKKKIYYNEKVKQRRAKKSEEIFGTKEERKRKSIERAKNNRKKYYEENKSRLRDYAKVYTKNNRSVINSKLKERINTDPQFKMASKLRTLLHVKLKNTKKVNHTFELVGCSVSEFKSYIESLFLPGMTWENNNRTGWHLDHKIPCAKFDLTKKENQYKCFHYTNFQPLWAVDNISKRDR